MRVVYTFIYWVLIGPKKSDEPVDKSQSPEKKEETRTVSPFEAMLGDDITLVDEDY